MNNVQLSIIVPIYNTVNYLYKTIESVHNQEFQEWELILVDDGSTDGSSIICDEWASKDKRIRVIHKSNTGLSDSRNIGIEQAKGLYVGFVDSDDWIEPNMYSFLIEQIMSNNADIAICNHFREGKETSICKDESDKIEILDHKKVHCLIIRDKIPSYIWQMLFRREFLTTPMPHWIFEDYSVIPYWFSNVKKVVHCKLPLYHYRIRKSSMITVPTPEKELAFFDAEYYRYNFYKDTEFKYESNASLVNCGIIIGKRIARMSFSNGKRKYAISCMKKISQVLRNLDEIRSENLSCKRRFLLSLLLKNPTIYVYYQQIASIFTILKNKNPAYVDAFE